MDMDVDMIMDAEDEWARAATGLFQPLMPVNTPSSKRATTASSYLQYFPLQRRSDQLLQAAEDDALRLPGVGRCHVKRTELGLAGRRAGRRVAEPDPQHRRDDALRERFRSGFVWFVRAQQLLDFCLLCVADLVA